MEDAVPEDGTPVAEQKEEPRILTTEELEERSEWALTVEGRLKDAKPFPVLAWECEVMVGSVETSLYERVFGGVDQLFSAKAPEKIDEAQIDRAFIKDFIISAVVKPKLTAKMLDNLIERSPVQFSQLAAFCMRMSQQDPTEAVSQRLGRLDTEAQELFFDAMAGSMSEQTPV